ncbi:hypothetical protein BBR47_12670 [Brevibacillus brevis NBRC 100599]|uniref:Uncharacterized protein n=1 Tax=Brevibacillus brevis (strain 47 / JCM 6285 / NBRC 100599) TaxID=358681 RepID=C0Z7K1_BREBN|nr:hypothetical protein BBR47_12670 [Brevibacillus brevis NBRC 100599]
MGTFLTKKALLLFTGCKAFFLFSKNIKAKFKYKDVN